MIEVQDLVKQYGGKHAVNGISFAVNEGEILGFLGPNGAGKTTTMNIITGYLSATSGTVKVGGIDILEDPIAAKRKIGYLPEQPPLYPDMTVKGYLDFMYELKGVKIPRRKHISEICETAGIADVYGRIIKNLSKGYRQRVGLAQALLGSPDVLILDEPTVGLDPVQIIEIRNLIKDLGKKHTVILSSHILPEVQAVCERVIVINKGNIAADDTPGNLSKSLSRDHKLLVRVDGAPESVLPVIKGIAGIIKAESMGERESGIYEYLIESEKGADIRRNLALTLAKNDFAVIASRSSELTLEDIFLQLTREEKMDHTGGEN